jgi:hypothetical protein
MERRDVTVNGMRSTFRTWAGERSRYHAHVIEMCLAHNIGNAVERAYARGDLFEKRRRLMSDWGKYCMTKPTTPPSRLSRCGGKASGVD